MLASYGYPPDVFCEYASFWYTRLDFSLRSSGQHDLCAHYRKRLNTDALAMLETHRPDALILDLMLPVMDGLTVLRKTSFRPHSILALTNLATPAVVQAAVDVGVQDMILIPCTIRHILEHLNALMEKAPSAES